MQNFIFGLQFRIKTIKQKKKTQAVFHKKILFAGKVSFSHGQQSSVIRHLSGSPDHHEVISAHQICLCISSREHHLSLQEFFTVNVEIPVLCNDLCIFLLI